MLGPRRRQWYTIKITVGKVYRLLGRRNLSYAFFIEPVIDIIEDNHSDIVLMQ